MQIFKDYVWYNNIKKMASGVKIFVQKIWQKYFSTMYVYRYIHAISIRTLTSATEGKVYDNKSSSVTSSIQMDYPVLKKSTLKLLLMLLLLLLFCCCHHNHRRCLCICTAFVFRFVFSSPFKIFLVFISFSWSSVMYMYVLDVSSKTLVIPSKYTN